MHIPCFRYICFHKNTASAGNSRTIRNKIRMQLSGMRRETTTHRKTERLQRGNATERHERNRIADGTSNRG